MKGCHKHPFFYEKTLAFDEGSKELLYSSQWFLLLSLNLIIPNAVDKVVMIPREIRM